MFFEGIFGEEVRIARKRKIPRESPSEGDPRHINVK